MKIKNSFLSVFVFICALVVGCDNPALHHRPSDKTCITWLDGKKIVLEKGIVFDDVWVMSADTFIAFDIVSIKPNADGSKTAAVKFEMKNQEKSLRVEAEMVYIHHKEDDVIEFKSWQPTRLLKLGVW